MSETANGSESGLEEAVHQRVRLGILALLSRSARLSFTDLRNTLAQTDGAMSRHLGVLESHGYVALQKVFEKRRPRTWVTLTPEGARALRREQDALAKLLAADTGTDDPDLTLAMTVAFAKVLSTGRAETSPTRKRSALVVEAPAAVGAAKGRAVLSGPITAGYEFPVGGFGPDQHAQRLMMMSHGLRGGWIRVWNIPGPAETSHHLACLTLELAEPSDTVAILGIMGESTLPMPDLPAARGYLIHPATVAATATAVGWFAHRQYLSCITASGPDADVTAALVKELTPEQHHHLTHLIGTDSP